MFNYSELLVVETAVADYLSELLTKEKIPSTRAHIDRLMYNIDDFAMRFCYDIGLTNTISYKSDLKVSLEDKTVVINEGGWKVVDYRRMFNGI